MVKIRLVVILYALAAAIVLSTLLASNFLLSTSKHRLSLANDKQQVELKLRIEQAEQQALMQKLSVTVLAESELAAQSLPQLRHLRLNYYQKQPLLQVGDSINAQVVLRSPRNLSNGLAFDYEAWLLQQRIDATGYIKTIEQHTKADTSPFRQQILTHYRQQLSAQAWPWVAGLLFGEQEAFNDWQWQLAKSTGTLHLLVVSGMHLGLLVVLAFILWGLLARLLAILFKRSFRHMALWRSLFVFTLTAGYLWLAGSGVALQRAWLMLGVALIIYNIRAHLNWLLMFALAILGVLIVNPLIWMAAGFQYSFLAVLSLLVFFAQRKNGKIEAFWLPQIVVFMALLPVFIYWQQPVSLMQCLANLLAIPWLTFVLMPLTVTTIMFPDIGQQKGLVWAGEQFWRWLQIVEFIPLSKLIYLPKISAFLWPVWLWLLLRGQGYFFARLTLFLVVFVVFTQPTKQQAQATLLDVGQGQSLVFSSEQHALVYDSGPFMGAFDSGEAIVTPVLRKLGIKQIDTLIISHQDNDHAGGTQALLNNFVVGDFYSGEPLDKLSRQPYLCEQLSSRWHVLDSQLMYRVLNINPQAWQYLPDTHNNHSCVVQVRWFEHTFLLVGDIAKPVEYQLIRDFDKELKSDVLVLAHHGSKSSSSAVFLEKVNPKAVWISAGYNNRFQHPAPEVLAILEKLKIPWYNSADLGRLWLTETVDKNGNPQSQRLKWQPSWRNQ